MLPKGMSSPRYFPSPAVKIPRDAVLRRLGYHRGRTEMSVQEERRIDLWMNRGAELLDLRGVSLRLPLSFRENNELLLGDRPFQSASLTRFLDGCDHVLLMGATGGDRLSRELKKLTQDGRMGEAVVYDAVASEMVDDVLGWIMEFQRRELVRSGLTLLKHRFSTGYGDLPMEWQSFFYNILGLKSLGVELTDSYLLVPEKSVTALTGITPARGEK